MNIKSIINKVKENKTTILTYVLFFFISFGMLYLTHMRDNHILAGDDGFFHKNRIENLAVSMVNGNFFPKINYQVLQGLGYASSIFYSDFFLYIPATVRALGFSLKESYLVLMFLLNFVTFIISYKTTLKINGNNKKTALLGALIYTLSNYRLQLFYKRAAIGELLAVALLPIILYGIHQIFYKDSKKWKLLAIGMTGLVLSHLLSVFMVAIFIVLLLIINAKRLYKERERIYALVKATALTIALTTFTLGPMFEQVSFQSLKLQTYKPYPIDADWISLFDLFKDNLTDNPMAITLGFNIFVLLFIYLFKWKQLSTVTKHYLIIALILTFISVGIIPSLLVHTVFNSLQFLSRFYSIVTVIVVALVCKDELKMLTKKFSLFLLTTVIVGFGIYQVFWVLRDAALPDEMFNNPKQYMIGNGVEYLPSVSDPAIVTRYDIGIFPVIGTDKWNDNNRVNKDEITDYKFNQSIGAITFNYNFTEPTEVTIPFLNYKGYKAFSDDTAVVINTSEIEAYRGLISVTLNGSGTFHIFYETTLIQHVTLVFSGLVFIVFILTYSDWGVYYQSFKRNKKA